MSEPIIRLRDVEKSYPTGPTRTYVLRRITLEIKDGEFLTIMGPSGAGKSTLLGILGMLDAAWSGEFFFMDGAVHAMKPKERAALNKSWIWAGRCDIHRPRDLRGRGDRARRVGAAGL